MFALGFIQDDRVYYSYIDGDERDVSDITLQVLSEDYIRAVVMQGDFKRLPYSIGEMCSLVTIRNYGNPNSVALEDIKDLDAPVFVFKDGEQMVIIDGMFKNPGDFSTEENFKKKLERRFINGTMINLEDSNDVGDFESFVRHIADKHWGYGYLDIFGKEICSLETSAMSEFKLDQFADLRGQVLLLVSTKEVEDYDGFSETEITLTLIAGSFFNQKD